MNGRQTAWATKTMRVTIKQTLLHWVILSPNEWVFLQKMHGQKLYVSAQILRYTTLGCKVMLLPSFMAPSVYKLKIRVL